MRESLRNWLADADQLKYADLLQLGSEPASVAYLRDRADDLFLALVSDLFERMRNPSDAPTDWSALGNAFADFGLLQGEDERIPRDAALFAAAAFYLGGFSASAYMMLESAGLDGATEGHVAAHELLARPRNPTSPRVQALLRAVRTGDGLALEEELRVASRMTIEARAEGPETWVGWRLYEEVLARFATVNVRTVLPGSDGDFWDPLIASFLRRSPPIWDFFPSQVQAIQDGLASSEETFALQMPTGAGKTALTEAVIYAHLSRHPDSVAVLLVPYRALASELRQTLVPRLARLGFGARAIFGGAVPTDDEARELDDLRAVIATPEALSGLLSADPAFARRISLVVVDEGHLLDGPTRGVGLELLLARMRGRPAGAPRFVFVSAIVPNVEEVNSWLGGSEETVVRSTYRPASAEFARLETSGTGRGRAVGLVVHPGTPDAFELDEFLSRADFQYLNAATGRQNTYQYETIKTRAVAAARKALQMGPVAVFAANKRGSQGCVGLADELLSQISVPVTLPTPAQFVRDQAALQAAVEYLVLEYGADWIGAKALQAGAVLHHGDVPQETREVLEDLLRRRIVGLAFCTNTLAEGVNLPIRTMVLYSVTRRSADGRTEDLLARDIRNLVGRAGRPGSATKGLVVCANPDQWRLVEPVANQDPGEPVHGALIELLRRLKRAILRDNVTLTNAALEQTPALHTLIDGVDATLIDLATEEMAPEDLRRLALELTDQTYAARIADESETALMHEVFRLRAERVLNLRALGRLAWIREAAARPRMLELVEEGLFTARERWDDVDDPMDPDLLRVVIEWAWSLPEIQQAAREAYRDDDVQPDQLRAFVECWLAGHPLRDIATAVSLSIDDALAVQARVIAYELHAVIEQGIALLGRLCQERGSELADVVRNLPEHLRFGVSNGAGLALAREIRHRRAAVALGGSTELATADSRRQSELLARARLLLDDTDRWLPVLGRLVLARTKADLDRRSAANAG